jgi:3-oxoacyl-[acyl-carrier protein] reductase
MQELTGKNALVTGGSRGLGKAIALALAKEGVNVAVTGRNKKKLEETVSELEALGVKSAFSIFNVAEKVEVKMQIQRLIDTFGSFDILVNNAGIAAFGSFVEMPENDWEDIIRTNLFGPYYVSKAVVPSMIERGSGDIINVSSTAGLKGNAVTSAYSASKAGLIALSESLMFELRKKNIRVTTLTPSTIASEMSKDILKITDGNPEKVLQPEDFAQLIVDLLKLDQRAMLASASLWSTNP